MKGATQRNIPDRNTMEKRTRINSSSGLSTSLDNPDSIKIHFHLKKTKQNSNIYFDYDFKSQLGILPYENIFVILTFKL